MIAGTDDGNIAYAAVPAWKAGRPREEVKNTETEFVIDHHRFS